MFTPNDKESRMNTDLVSIFIPVFNRADLVEETINSALKQTYKNIEVIVVDNKSTDNTWEVLKRLALHDKRIKIFQNDTNIGPVRNWKICIEKGKGNYGKILFSDDLMAFDFIEKTIGYLKDESIGFVFTGREIFKNNKEKTTLSYMSIGDTNVYPSSKYINGVLFEKNYPNSPGCALFRLKDLKENLLTCVPNKIDSDFAMHGIGSDLLIFLITCSKYKNFAFINENLAYFRAHDGSITIDSGSGKLLLMYAVAKAFFIENYLKNNKEIIHNFNSQLKLLMFQYDARKFLLNEIDDFYSKNNIYSFSKIIYIKCILIMIKKVAKNILGKKYIRQKI